VISASAPSLQLNSTKHCFFYPGSFGHEKSLNAETKNSNEWAKVSPSTQILKYREQNRPAPQYAASPRYSVGDDDLAASTHTSEVGSGMVCFMAFLTEKIMPSRLMSPVLL
jgi:hypothetical protein